MKRCSYNMHECLATGAIMPEAQLLRFVLSPFGELLPDIRGTLPGKDVWISSNMLLVEKACTLGLFREKFGADIKLDRNIAETTYQMLKSSCLGLLGIARKSGFVVVGQQKVADLMSKGAAFIVFSAADSAGAIDGHGKVKPISKLFSAKELSATLGHENANYVALKSSNIAESLKIALERFYGYIQEV